MLGASGFIGRRVVRALRAEGAECVAVVRDRSGHGLDSGSEGIEVVAQDLADANGTRKLVDRVRPAIAFNLAGYGVDRSERDDAVAEALNHALPATLGDALHRASLPAWEGLRLVHVGTALEYGRRSDDLAEDMPSDPDTVYGRTKLAGTAALSALHREGMRCLTARLFTVYGPGEHQGRLLPSLMDAARTGESLSLTAGTQARDFVYVDDVAEGLLRLGALPGVVPDVLNLATGRLSTVRDFVETAAALLGIPADRLRFSAAPTRPEEMHHQPVTIARLRTLTGWIPATTLREGIALTAAATGLPSRP